MAYSDEELLEHLQQLADKLGRAPTQADMNIADGYPSVATFYSHFGSWNAAKKKAGLETQKASYAKGKLLELLQELADELNHVPTAEEMDDAEGYPDSNTYRTRFGTWNDAKEAAGFESEYRHSKDELVELLQELANELGETPTAAEMNDTNGYPSATLYHVRFGSWEDAKEQAELA